MVNGHPGLHVSRANIRTAARPRNLTFFLLGRDVALRWRRGGSRLRKFLRPSDFCHSAGSTSAGHGTFAPIWPSDLARNRAALSGKRSATSGADRRVMVSKRIPRFWREQTSKQMSRERHRRPIGRRSPRAGSSPAAGCFWESRHKVALAIAAMVLVIGRAGVTAYLKKDPRPALDSIPPFFHWRT